MCHKERVKLSRIVCLSCWQNYYSCSKECVLYKFEQAFYKPHKETCCPEQHKFASVSTAWRLQHEHDAMKSNVSDEAASEQFSTLQIRRLLEHATSVPSSNTRCFGLPNILVLEKQKLATTTLLHMYSKTGHREQPCYTCERMQRLQAPALPNQNFRQRKVKNCV